MEAPKLKIITLTSDDAAFVERTARNQGATEQHVMEAAVQLYRRIFEYRAKGGRLFMREGPDAPVYELVLAVEYERKENPR